MDSRWILNLTMITTKKINLGISFTSKILRLVLVFYFAMILANCVWWMLNPSQSDFYIEKSDPDQSDKSSNYIVNRYPMGIITTRKEVVEKPRIVDQVKLTGVYASDSQNSIAFLEYGGKSIIVKQGGAINGQAKIKSIKPTSIVVVEDGIEATINISKSTSSGGGEGYNSSSSSNGMSSIFGSGQANPPIPPQPYYNQPNNEQNDYQEKRRKMLEEVMQKERGNYPDNGHGNNPPGGYPPNSYPPGYPSDNMNR